MSKATKDETALLEEYARALAVVGEAPASMRSNRLRDIGLTTTAFLDLSKQAGAAMDRALDDPDGAAVAAFAATFEAERARLRAKEQAPATGQEKTEPGPPPDFGGASAAPAAPGLKPLAPVPVARVVAAPSSEERTRPAPPPMVARPGPGSAVAPAATPPSIAPVPPAPPAPAPAPLGRGTLRMAVNPSGSVQARVLSAAVAPLAGRGGDTIYNPTQLPMLPAVPATSPSAVMPPISAPRSALPTSAAATSAPLPRSAALTPGASGARSGRAPRLTLMEYAALRADILVSSDAERAEVYALFGFTEADDTTEAAAWNARFTADRDLFARYMQLFNYLRALRGAKR